jgi:hypothetical protein
MEHSDLARLQSWFANYVSGFFTGSDELDRVFKLKQMHTERVCFTIRRLGKALQLSSRDLLLAEVAALLHDVGRFSQFARYRTFRDKDSTHHGRLGRVVPIDAVRSVVDAKLLYISWVFDLNFPASFRETVGGRYLERLAATIPLSADIRSVLQCASDHAARKAAGL